MATLKMLTEGQEFIDSILYSLPSHRMVHRGYLPQDVANRLPADVRDIPAQQPRPAAPAPRPTPQAQPAAPAPRPAAQAAQGAQGAPAADYGDPGVGTKTNRFNIMYQRMNGSGITRSEFVENVMQRLQMTRAGATTYMANAARAHGAWRLR